MEDISSQFQDSQLELDNNLKTFKRKKSQQNSRSKRHQKIPKVKDFQTVIFTFPLNILLFQNLQGKNQFKKILRSEAGKSNYDQGWKYQEQIFNKQKRTFICCRNCHAYIRYMINSDQSWTLLNYKNLHIHKIQKNQAHEAITQLAIFQNLHMTNKQLYQSINTKYPMSKQAFLIKKKQILKNKNFSLIKTILRQKHYQIRYIHSADIHSQEGYPQTLVAVSDQQKINYQKFGQCISYDITYNCIKQKSVNKKSYGIGIFSGFDCNNRVLMFGFSITTFETINDFKNVFKWFFDIMAFTHTTCIITDQQKSLIIALEELKTEYKYHYHHAFDNFHFIRSFRTNALKTKTKSKQTISKISKQLKKAMSEIDPKIGEVQLHYLKQMMITENFQNEYKKIQNKLQHVCFWLMPKQFLGLRLHTNQCINDMLKLKAEYETTFAESIQIIDKVSQQRNNKCQNERIYETFPFDLFYEDEKIQQVRNKVQKKPFYMFIYNYKRSLSYRIIERNRQQNNSNIHLYLIEQIFDEDYYTIKDWKCSCNATDKTGIPCQHLIFINRFEFQEQNYLKLFNPRWICQQLLDHK